MAIPKPPIARSARRLAALALPVLVLAGCAGSTPLIPERPGLYAVTGAEGTELTRLGGARGEQWAALNDLPPDARFVVAAAGLGQAQSAYPKALHLRAAAWVRSEIGPDGNARPVTGKDWAVPDLESYRVPADYEYVGTREGMDVVQLVPKNPLDPGLYKLTARIAEGRDYAARLGIAAAGLNRSAYAQDHCVDRLIGQDRSYRPCEAAPPVPETGPAATAALDDGGAAGAPALEIGDLELDRVEREAGTVLLVRGRVKNTSQSRQPVPRIQGELLDGDGAVLQRWSFTANARRLDPGASTDFTTVRDLTGDGRRQVRVTFQN
jgi:hypothetical protein